MALADVLSAMRQIILDAPGLPADTSERDRDFMKRFPRLSDSEREDLARIDPRKFSIYTTSIFQSEKGILENHLPISYRLVSENWAEAYQERFVGRKLTQRLHLKYPWQSQRTAVFIRNFSRLINEDCAELLAIRPDLGAIAQLECATFELKRSPDNETGTSKETLSFESLAALTVAELLSCALTLNPPFTSLSLDYDVLPLRDAYYAHDKLIASDASEKRRTFQIGTRQQSNRITWLSVKESVFEYLNKLLQSGGRGSVGEFAEQSLSREVLNTPPEKALELVVSDLGRLMAAEAIILTRS